MVLGERPRRDPISLSDKPEATSRRICACRGVTRIPSPADLVGSSSMAGAPCASTGSISSRDFADAVAQLIEIPLVRHPHEFQRVLRLAAISKQIAVHGGQLGQLGQGLAVE